MFDEELLRQLDATEEVRRDGRSAVLRRAASEYLEKPRDAELSEAEIAAAYARGYGGGGGLGEDWEAGNVKGHGLLSK